MRKINEAGINIIRGYEGIEDGDPSTVNLDPYICPASIWTIGFGHSIFYNNKQLTEERDPFGIIAKRLYPKGITMKEAELLLELDSNNVASQISRVIKVKVNENEFSALVSLAFNIGSENFTNSTLLKKLNKGDYAGAVDQFSVWRKSKGKVLSGLVKRRAAEKALFLKK